MWLAVGFDSDGQAPWFTMRIDLPESEAAVMLGEVVALCSKRGHPGLWQQTAGVPS